MIRRQEFLKNKWLQSGSKRKVFLGESKTKYAIKLLENNYDFKNQIYSYLNFDENIFDNTDPNPFVPIPARSSLSS